MEKSGDEFRRTGSAKVTRRPAAPPEPPAPDPLGALLVPDPLGALLVPDPLGTLLVPDPLGTLLVPRVGDRLADAVRFDDAAPLPGEERRVPPVRPDEAEPCAGRFRCAVALLPVLGRCDLWPTTCCARPRGRCAAFPLPRRDGEDDAFCARPVVRDPPPAR